MRLLLDAHVSGPNVGHRLEEKGHDVRSLDQEPALEGLDDDDVLTLAATEQRILVTHNVADFPRILREWAAAQRAHAGVILVYGIDHSEFGLIVLGIERWLQLRPDQADWSDFPAILSRKTVPSVSRNTSDSRSPSGHGSVPLAPAPWLGA